MRRTVRPSTLSSILASAPLLCSADVLKKWALIALHLLAEEGRGGADGCHAPGLGGDWKVGGQRVQCGRGKAKLCRKTKVCPQVALVKAMCAMMRCTSSGCMGLVARSLFVAILAQEQSRSKRAVKQFSLSVSEGWFASCYVSWHGVGDGWPPSAGRLVLGWLLLSVPEFCVPPLVLLWPKFDYPCAPLFFSFLMSVSGSQVCSLVPMAVDGRTAGKNTLKGSVFVPAAWSLLVSGVCETVPKDMVFEVSGGAGRCEADSQDMVSEAPGNPGCCKGSSRLSLVSKWFSQAQCFCFMATLVVSGFCENGMVENGSLVAASCCSSLST